MLWETYKYPHVDSFLVIDKRLPYENLRNSTSLISVSKLGNGYNFTVSLCADQSLPAVQ